jgi:hypothetical protein
MTHADSALAHLNATMNARLRRASGYGHLVSPQPVFDPPSYDGGARSEPVTESQTPMSDLLHAVLRSARSVQPVRFSQHHIHKENEARP